MVDALMVRLHAVLQSFWLITYTMQSRGHFHVAALPLASISLQHAVLCGSASAQPHVFFGHAPCTRHHAGLPCCMLRRTMPSHAAKPIPFRSTFPLHAHVLLHLKLGIRSSNAFTDLTCSSVVNPGCAVAVFAHKYIMCAGAAFRQRYLADATCSLNNTCLSGVRAHFMPHVSTLDHGRLPRDRQC